MGASEEGLAEAPNVKDGLGASEEGLAEAPNVKDGLGASEEGLAGAPNVKGGLASVEPNAGVAAGLGTSPAAFNEEGWASLDIFGASVANEALLVSASIGGFDVFLSMKECTWAKVPSHFAGATSKENTAKSS